MTETSPEQLKPRHDAKWTPTVLNKIAEIVETRGITGHLFDPFAGIGHGVDKHFQALEGCYWSGVDIEPEWADALPWIVQGDALDPAAYASDEGIQAIFTSATYANRMAGSYVGEKCETCIGSGVVPEEPIGDELRGWDECPDCGGVGRMNQRRYGYGPSLGRSPSEGSSALLNWGPKYKRFHMQWLMVLADVLEPGDARLILNMGDHHRKWERQYVCEWWIGAARSAGFGLAEAHTVDTPKLGDGQNGQDRATGEMVLVFDLLEES